MGSSVITITVVLVGTQITNNNQNNVLQKKYKTVYTLNRMQNVQLIWQWSTLFSCGELNLPVPVRIINPVKDNMGPYKALKKTLGSYEIFSMRSIRGKSQNPKNAVGVDENRNIMSRIQLPRNYNLCQSNSIMILWLIHEIYLFRRCYGSISMCDKVCGGVCFIRGWPASAGTCFVRTGSHLLDRLGKVFHSGF